MRIVYGSLSDLFAAIAAPLVMLTAGALYLAARFAFAAGREGDFLLDVGSFKCSFKRVP